MNKAFTGLICLLIVSVAACAPLAAPVQPTETPVPSATMEPSATSTPLPASPTPTQQPVETNSYTNDEFNLSFQFPLAWFGPEEYINENTLRVEVGSDRVYPYGTDPVERVYERTNSYSIIIQYTRENRNEYWKEIYQTLQNLNDGESFSDARSMVVRIGNVTAGQFKGLEYITTLSETAQTEPVYIRQVILTDDKSNLLTVIGTPNNVQIPEGGDWREIFRSIDEENQVIFHAILESLQVQ